MIQKYDLSLLSRFLRITSEPLIDDHIYLLTNLSHLHGCSIMNPHDVMYDWSLLNEKVETIWLSVNGIFYTEYAYWIQKAKEEFKGNIFNLEIQTDQLNNLFYAYDFRIAYAQGHYYVLNGSPTNKQIEQALEYANSVNLDIGIINFEDNHWNVSTLWGFNLSDTIEEAKIQTEFLNKIFELCKADISAYNKITPEHVNKVASYQAGYFELDLSYEDVSTTKSLVISDWTNELGNQIRVLIRYKGLENSIEVINEHEDLLALDLSLYDSIYFIPPTSFIDKHTLFISKVRQQYKGKVYNLDALKYLVRDKLFDKWLTLENIRVPRYRSLLGNIDIDKLNIDFSVPYILRSIHGQGGQSYPVQTWQEDYINQWPWWMWGNHYAARMVQEFIDVRTDQDTYKVGRVIYVNGKVIPVYALECTNWEARPKPNTLISRSVGPNCFQEMFEDWDKVENFERCIEEIFSSIQLDVGSLDFSVLDGRIVPWDICARWGHSLINRFKKESCELLAQVFNEILLTLNNPLKITSEEMQVVLEESILEDILCQATPLKVFPGITY